MAVRARAKLEIRRMTPADLDDVMVIERAAFRHPWSPELFRRELEHDWSTILVALEPLTSASGRGSERVVGFPPARAGQRLERDQDGAPVVLELAPEQLRRPGVPEGGALDHHHVVEVRGCHAPDLELRARPDCHPTVPRPRCRRHPADSSTRTAARRRRSARSSRKSRWYFSCASCARRVSEVLLRELPPPRRLLQLAIPELRSELEAVVEIAGDPQLAGEDRADLFVGELDGAGERVVVGAGGKARAQPRLQRLHLSGLQIRTA